MSAIDAVWPVGSSAFGSLEEPPPNRLEKKPPTPPELDAGVGAAGALETGADADALPPPAIAVCGPGVVAALTGKRRRFGEGRLRHRRHVADACLVVGERAHLDGVGSLCLRQSVLEPQRAGQIGDGEAGFAELAEGEATVIEHARHLRARQSTAYGGFEGAQRLFVLAGAVGFDAALECLLHESRRLALLVGSGLRRPAPVSRRPLISFQPWTSWHRSAASGRRMRRRQRQRRHGCQDRQNAQNVPHSPTRIPLCAAPC